MYRWEFDKGRQSLAVAVNGPPVVDDVQVMLRAAIDGAGLAFTLEDHVAPHLESGALRLQRLDFPAFSDVRTFSAPFRFVFMAQLLRLSIEQL
jgi:DNA-binding transcriptional LysR family regulator